MVNFCWWPKKIFHVSILTFPIQVVAYIAYGAAMLALIVLRWKKPDTDTWKRDFKVTLKSRGDFSHFLIKIA